MNNKTIAENLEDSYFGVVDIFALKARGDQIAAPTRSFLKKIFTDPSNSRLNFLPP